jgi:hypothetical protein
MSFHCGELNPERSRGIPHRFRFRDLGDRLHTTAATRALQDVNTERSFQEVRAPHPHAPWVVRRWNVLRCLARGRDRRGTADIRFGLHLHRINAQRASNLLGHTLHELGVLTRGSRYILYDGQQDLLIRTGTEIIAGRFRGLIRCWGRFRGTAGQPWPPRRPRRHDIPSPPGIRRQDAVIPDHVRPRRRNQGGQLALEFHRLQDEMRDRGLEAVASSLWPLLSFLLTRLSTYSLLSAPGWSLFPGKPSRAARCSVGGNIVSLRGL